MQCGLSPSVKRKRYRYVHRKRNIEWWRQSLGCEASNPGAPRGFVTAGSEEEKENPPVDPTGVLGPQIVREQMCIAWCCFMKHALIKVKYRCFTTMKSLSGFIGQVFLDFDSKKIILNNNWLKSKILSHCYVTCPSSSTVTSAQVCLRVSVLQEYLVAFLNSECIWTLVKTTGS